MNGDHTAGRALEQPSTSFMEQPSRYLFFTGKVEQIQVVRERHAKRIAIVPWMTEEPVGPARLLALARATASSLEHSVG
jgi:hypothetical protein